MEKCASCRNDVREGATGDGDLEHATVMTVLEIVVVPETDSYRGTIRDGNKNGQRVQIRVCHTTGSIMERGVWGCLRIPGYSRPVAAQSARIGVGAIRGP